MCLTLLCSRAPLPLTPERVADTQQQKEQRVARPALTSRPPEDWKDEMKRKMQAMIRDSMRDMMAMLPVREPTPRSRNLTTHGPGLPVYHAGNWATHGPGSTVSRTQGPGPLSDVPRNVPATTHHELFAEKTRWAPPVVHTGGRVLPLGHPVAVSVHVIEWERTSRMARRSSGGGPGGGLQPVPGDQRPRRL